MTAMICPTLTTSGSASTRVSPPAAVSLGAAHAFELLDGVVDEHAAAGAVHSGYVEGERDDIARHAVTSIEPLYIPMPQV